MEVLKDKVCTCKDCNEDFVLFKHEQLFFMRIADEKKKKDPKARFHMPKRCPACRALRKQQKEEREKIHEIKVKQQIKLDEVVGQEETEAKPDAATENNTAMSGQPK